MTKTFVSFHLFVFSFRLYDRNFLFALFIGTPPSNGRWQRSAGSGVRPRARSLVSLETSTGRKKWLRRSDARRRTGGVGGVGHQKLSRNEESFLKISPDEDSRPEWYNERERERGREGEGKGTPFAQDAPFPWWGRDPPPFAKIFVCLPTLL